MNTRYVSAPVLSCYDGEGEPDPVPVVDWAAKEAAWTAREKEFSEKEAAWNAKEAEYVSNLADRDTKLSEIRARDERNAIRQSLVDAAVSEEAVVPAQIVALLTPLTRTENGEVVVEIDGKILKPTEAIAAMKDDAEQYGNLFRPRGVAGMGAHNGAEFSARGMGGRVDLSRLTSQEYRRLRRENPAALGLTRKPEARR